MGIFVMLCLRLSALCSAVLILIATASGSIAAEPDVELMSASKTDLLERLTTLKDINDPGAEVILWRLGFDHQLAEDDIGRTVRFLNSADCSTYSAAVECLKQTKDPDTIRTLREQLDSPELFRVFRAATVLHHKGEDEGIKRLISKLKNTSAPVEERRDLTRRLFGTDPRFLFPVYIDLLNDPSKWVRYNAINQIRGVTHENFGYDYEDKTDNTAAVTAWSEWYEDNKDSLPREWKRDIDDSPAGIGATIVSEEEGVRVVKVIAEHGAANAGIGDGDVIKAVNGYSVKGKTLLELVSYEFRGQEGTKVDVSFENQETGMTQTVTIVRNKLY